MRRVPDGRRTVRNHHYGSVTGQCVESLYQPDFGHRIDPRGRFIEDHKASVPEEYPGQCQELGLPRRQPTRPHTRTNPPMGLFTPTRGRKMGSDPVWERRQPRTEPHSIQSGHHGRIRNLRIEHGHVVSDTRVEKRDILVHHRNHPAELNLRHRGKVNPSVTAADFDVPPSGFDFPCNQSSQCRLAASGMSDDREETTRRQFEREVRHRRLITILVREGEVLHGNTEGCTGFCPIPAMILELHIRGIRR